MEIPNLYAEIHKREGPKHTNCIGYHKITDNGARTGDIKRCEHGVIMILDHFGEYAHNPHWSSLRKYNFWIFPNKHYAMADELLDNPTVPVIPPLRGLSLYDRGEQ